MSLNKVQTVGQFYRELGMPEPNIAQRAALAEKFDVCPAKWYVDSPEQNQMLLRELLRRYASGSIPK